MHNEGYSTMCGHGIIAVTTIAIERGLIAAAAATARPIVYDAPAGHDSSARRRVGAAQVRRGARRRVESVAFVERAVVRAARRR